MKVTQLQLNDWISTKNGFPMQVVGLYKDVAYLDFEGNEGDMWEEEEKDLYPIPITLEILEKNGFRHYTTPSDGIHPKDEYYYWESGSIYISLKKYDRWKVFVEKTEGVYGRRAVFQGYIDSVHELQHKLKECRIDKEIKL